MQLRLPAFRSAATLSVIALALLFPSLFTVRLQAQANDCGSDAYLASLPVKPPKDPSTKRQVQLINCSNQILLGAAGAAHEADAPPWPVFPQEGTWVMQPYRAGSAANVLTVDIPTEWYGQFRKSGVAPNFWARTGCRYDPITNRAQCETGSCGGQYDCSSANLGPPPATTIIEWTFYQQFGSYFFDSPDISAVNGANLTVEISPKGGDAKDPLNAKDFHWLNWNYPLTVHGADLREPGNCEAPPNIFKVLRTDVGKLSGGLADYPLLGYVIVDGNGNPTMPAGNYVLACLSNCGKYKFPVEVGKPGCNAKTDPNCYFWDTFCAGDIAINYGSNCKTGIGDGGYWCNTDADCLKCNPVDYHLACFEKSGPGELGTCELRGFFKGTVPQCNGINGQQPTGPTNKITCPNTYGSVNPLDSDEQTKYDWADQPIVGTCDSVVFTPTGQKAACVGDDTLHKILHGAYTWPNDPQVYQSNATVYRIVFEPGGRGNAPITGAQILPNCDKLPANYKPSSNRANCSNPIVGQNSDFGIGVVRNQGPPGEKWYSTGTDWPCFLPQRSSGDNGVVCEWNPLPANTKCRAPKTDDTYVTQGACGITDGGVVIVSGSITPDSGDPLFLEVSIPAVLSDVSLPKSISGCVPTGMGIGAWTLVASKAVNTNQGIIAWYKGKSNTSVACKVTVTLASPNPAELKLYDVPKFNGTLDTMSSASGTYINQPLPYTVSAGSATTTRNDLQLGALLQVDLAPTPITYWDTWLANSPPNPQNFLCLNENIGCPRDDGADYLPGHGPYSSNSDVGHNPVTAGPNQLFFRNAGIVIPDDKTKTPGSSFAWAGLAIYVQLNP